MKSTSIQHYQDRYQINHTSAQKQFLKWDVKSQLQIKDQDFSWGSLFEADPYLIYSNDSNGQLFPDIAIFSFRADAEDLNVKYYSFINELKLSQPPKLAEISQLHNYRNLASKQLNDGLNRLEELDQEIIAVLKVFLYEALKQADLTEYDSIRKGVQEFYHTDVRRFCVPDLFQKHYIPYYLKPITVDDTIKESSIEGILYFVREKDRIINKLTPTFMKFIFLEAIVSQLLNELESAEPRTSIENAKNEFQKKLLQLEKENEPIRGAVVQIAIHIIYEVGTGRPQEYFGKKGWPIKNLWGHERLKNMKYVLPAISTLRKWLADAYKDGKIRPPANGQLTAS